MKEYYIRRYVDGVSLIEYTSDYDFDNYTEFWYREDGWLEVNQFTESLDEKYPHVQYDEITKDEFDKERSLQESYRGSRKPVTDNNIISSPEYDSIPCPTDEQLFKLMVVLRKTNYIWNSSDAVSVKEIKEIWNKNEDRNI